MKALIVLLCALTLGACSDPAADAVIRMGLASAPVNLDPRIAADAASARLNRLLYARLVDFGEQDRPVPALAEWTRAAPDRYELRLRDADARRFADGTRLSAADVKATLESILDPAIGSPFRTQLQDVAEILVDGPDRLTIRLARPDPLFPAKLAVEILPARLIAAGHAFNREPVGSGPLRLVGWPESGRLVLERKTDGQRIEVLEVKDPGVRVMKLLRGEIDLLQSDLSPELFQFLRGRAEVRVVSRPGSNFTYVGLNLEDAQLSNPAVRRALALAVDRRAIVRYVLAGAARPAQSLLPPDHWAGAGDLPVFARDLAEARALLRQAGYGPERPLELEYKTSTDPFRVRLATVIQAQLAEAGIRVKVRSLDWGTFFGDVKNGRFQMHSLTWVGVKTPDQFRYVFHSASVPPLGANRGRYRSAAADALIERAEALADPADQAAVYRELQSLLLNDLPYVPLWYEDQLAAFREGVTGYGLAADGNYDGLVSVRREPRP
jgi:peptide/nickel transport system substrate-binding protein